MRAKYFFIILVVILCIVGLSTYAIVANRYARTTVAESEYLPTSTQQVLVTNFFECLVAGYPVLESYPRVCRTDSLTFTEDIGNELELIDLIQMINPRPGQVVYTGMEVMGTARGQWYFEASFPVYLLDADNNQLNTFVATATTDWMTNDYVPFTFIFDHVVTETSTATLLLQKANPSGEAINDAALSVPILLIPNNNE